MTHDTLVEANRLNHAISELEARIALVEDMHHCDNNLTLEVDQIGAVTLDGCDELKNDILNLVLSSLNNKKGILEDRFRLL